MAKRNELLTVPCKILPAYPALYASFERPVYIEPEEGKTSSVAFIDRKHLSLEKELQQSEVVDGRVKIRLVQVTEEFVLFDLPAPGLVDGPRFQVTPKWADENIKPVQFASE